MRHPLEPRVLQAGWLSALMLFLSLGGRAASLPADWQHAQQFEVQTPGLVKLKLPVDTLDASRPGFEDLRLHDSAGVELPYWIELPTPASKTIQSVRSFQTSLTPTTTVITIDSGLSTPLEGVTLETPAAGFIKSVKAEASPDGQSWQTLSQGLPIFRQFNGASQLRLPIPEGIRPWIRLTVDDRRTPPIPFTGCLVHVAAGDSATPESLPITLVERNENPGETRLTLDLGGANLHLAAIQIETSEPLFTRQVTLAIPEVLEDSIRERTIGRSMIYRVAVEGQPPADNTWAPLEAQVRSRQLFVLISNQDSPPLPISAVRATRRPTHLVFLARSSGVHHLLTGNPRCPAPRYDLAALGPNLKSTTVSSISLSPVMTHSGFRTPEVLPGVEIGGSALDVSAWRFRKAVKLARSGAQQLELDLDVLAHAGTEFHDLRLLKDGKQAPYILERTSIHRVLTPSVSATKDAKDPKLSRWIIQLSHSGLPITRLSCRSRTPLFQREMTLFEEVTNGRGEKYKRVSGSASWVQTPDNQRKELTVTFGGRTESATLFLETHDGDNPAIELESFQLFHTATRVLFKGTPEDRPFLYYGNEHVGSPRYDLSLVAGQLLRAERSPASLAAEEPLKKSPWGTGNSPGKGGILFWGVLAVVVVALLAIISRLLPSSTPPAGE